jgi:pyruvate/2-oxoglutarate dehydrogenase complex dihydrolipoamide acyltransferase (E2) component
MTIPITMPALSPTMEGNLAKRLVKVGREEAVLC